MHNTAQHTAQQVDFMEEDDKGQKFIISFT